jgi:hypothetical protein
MRVSLRPIQTSLAWLQSRRLAPPSLACVLRDQGPLRALEAAPPPKTWPRGRYTAWPDARTVRFRAAVEVQADIDQAQPIYQYGLDQRMQSLDRGLAALRRNN